MLLGGLLLFAIKPVSSVLGPFLSVLILRWGSVPVLAVPYLRHRLSDGRGGALKLISGVAFFDTVANLAYIIGLNFGTVTIVSPLAGLASSVTVLLACAILKERMSRHNLVGLIAIALGVGMLGTFG
jgi:drug/metabolite transporter (DMT)-like permease